jgi:phosphoglycerate dehydrogenase-like enzyme
VLITAGTMDEVGQTALALLRKAGCEPVVPPQYGPHTEETLLTLLPAHDAVLASIDAFTAPVLDSPDAAQLKIISRWGVGCDAIDVAAATRHGIVVANTPGVLNETVADFAFALLLAVARCVHVAQATMSAGRWQPAWGREVHGKALGLVGCGGIGQAMARRARGFDLRLLGYDVAPSPAAEETGIRFVPLDALLAQSDFVSLHAALTPQSRGMLGEAQLRRMKPSACLINAARGALVDEAALARALQEGWIAGAALDAFVEEPLPAEHPLRRAPNVLLTPHCASFARETGERVSLAAAQAIVDLSQGRRPQWVVNEPVFKSPQLRAAVTR